MGADIIVGMDIAGLIIGGWAEEGVDLARSGYSFQIERSAALPPSHYH